ncbi:MAG: hypothetical protein K0R17_724 [Rariglobus sp.]|jgi:hypothetical protein|nr:hypothetical protein [Rariglobus sp.]
MITSRLFPLFLAVLVTAVLPLSAQEAVSLLDAEKPKLGWWFNDGREFPGARGDVEKDVTVQQGGAPTLKVTGDFTGGGIYVSADGRIPDIDVKELSFWVKNLADDRLTLRVIEASGRCHQFVLQAKPSSDWQQITLPLRAYFERQGRADAVEGVLKYEAWGGGSKSFKNDGAWKGPGTAVSIVISNSKKEAVVRTLWIGSVTVIPQPKPQPVSTFNQTFEDPQGLASWKLDGTVGIENGSAYQGEGSLVLRKTEGTLRDKVTATGPEFKVGPGTLLVEFATKSDLTSMDNSYNGTLSIEFINAAGKPLGPYELGAWFRQNPWKKTVAQVQVPDGAASARLTASINKESPGFFALDVLSAKLTAGETADDGLRRMMFTLPRLGHLLYPDDPRKATVEVWSEKELPENLREAVFTVRDYWGAEQSRPLQLTLLPAGKAGDKKDVFKYEGTVDFSKVSLSVGRYYELHGKIARPGTEAFANYTSFAILPEAEANRYKPEEIPFTSRTWDQRFKESPLLTHRLGIRICNVWGEMAADPAKVSAAQIDLTHELGMGVVTGSPAHAVEMRRPEWRELLANDGEQIRKGVRNFVAKYGHVKPMIINLGNEPHSKGDDVKYDVNAYRIVYQEIKKIDPSITVVASSMGLTEDYFKQGFGEWCDAYDFHSYEDPEGVRTIVEEKYPAMFKKYGFPRPVWSTELGMNSQGMTRLAVAGLLHKKFANFFAGGGANASWFGLFYPDPDAKIHNSFGSAHNVFDCRYNKYAPKLDAIAYYNAVNGIAVKKFVTDKVYPDGARVFLFTDRDHRSLLVAYRDKGREDVFLPLPGVKAAEMIRIDGSRDRLDVGGKGLSLTIGEDPLLILYENGPQSLPAKLEPSPVRFTALPPTLHRDAENILVALADGVSPDVIDLQVPPFWEVRRETTTVDGKPAVRFTVKIAPESELREADLALVVRGSDREAGGLLSTRIPVASLLSMELLPIPAGDQQGPGVKLAVRNNSTKAQSLTWNVTLNGEQSLAKGQFTGVLESGAHFAIATSGSLDVKARSTAEVLLPLAGIKPVTVYHVKAVLRDDSGRVLSQERSVAGFVPVPRAFAPMKIDGILDEKSWGLAPVQTVDQPDQFYGFKFSGKEAPVWTNPDDLSARIRYLWDERFLYVAVKVTDDVAGGTAYMDADLWQMDGLQFLVDPARRSPEKPGKYEYSVARGAKGAQVWCALSADSGAAPGDVKDIIVAIHRDKEGTGDVAYEVALPWSRLAPFKPGAGGNLGFTLIVNEDDGQGRNAFMTWFGNAHTKDIDTVGDLILLP